MRSKRAKQLRKKINPANEHGNSPARRGYRLAKKLYTAFSSPERKIFLSKVLKVAS